MEKFKKKALAVIASAVMSVCSLLPLSACGENLGYEKKDGAGDFLQVSGERVKNADGEEILLRGVNAGGLFVTEHWMTGFVKNKTPSNDYKSLTETFIKRFKEDGAKALWKTFRENWWTDVDFKTCADMGMNVIRLPFTYMNVDFGAITDYDKAGKYDFSDIDAFVQRASDYGMYTILDLHGAYGSQNGKDHSGQIISESEPVDFYYNEKMQTLTVNLWSALSAHYKDNPAVAGYDILNEPGEQAGNTSERHWNFYDKVYDAIRATGDKHIVIFESCWNGENLPQPTKYGWENCMYSFHHYTSNTDQSAEGVLSHNLDWNGKIDNVTSQNFGVPLQMGEFTSYTSAEKWDYTLDLLNRANWSWTSWTYKVWGNMPWGVVNVLGSNADKVDPVEDSYEEIERKFKLLRTDGDQAKKYTFENGTTLESIISKYAKMDIYGKIEEGEYTLSVGEKYVAPDLSGKLVLSDEPNSATALTLTYHRNNDTSAYLTDDSRYLTVSGKNLVLSAQAGNASRFYPVAYKDGFALVSYSLCKYITVDSDGALSADGSTLSDAAVFLL